MFVGEDGRELAAHPHVQAALGERGASNAGGLFGNGVNSFHLQGHGRPPRNDFKAFYLPGPVLGNSPTVSNTLHDLSQENS